MNSSYDLMPPEDTRQFLNCVAPGKSDRQIGASVLVNGFIVQKWKQEGMPVVKARELLAVHLSELLEKDTVLWELTRKHKL